MEFWIPEIFSKNLEREKKEIQSARFELAPPERLEPKSNALDHSAKTAYNNTVVGNLKYINVQFENLCKIVTFTILHVGTRCQPGSSGPVLLLGLGDP